MTSQWQLDPETCKGFVRNSSGSCKVEAVAAGAGTVAVEMVEVLPRVALEAASNWQASTTISHKALATSQDPVATETSHPGIDGKSEVDS